MESSSSQLPTELRWPEGEGEGEGEQQHNSEEAEETGADVGEPSTDGDAAATSDEAHDEDDEDHPTHAEQQPNTEPDDDTHDEDDESNASTVSGRHSPRPVDPLDSSAASRAADSSATADPAQPPDSTSADPSDVDEVSSLLSSGGPSAVPRPPADGAGVPSYTRRGVRPRRTNATPPIRTDATSTTANRSNQTRIDYTPRMHLVSSGMRVEELSKSSDTFLTGVDLADPSVSRSSITPLDGPTRRPSLSLIGDDDTPMVVRLAPSLEPAQEEGGEGGGHNDGRDDVEEDDRINAELTDFAEWLTDEVPYKLQGDEQFYTPEALSARGALVKHPKILRLIDKFWRSIRGLDMKFGLMRDEFVTLQVKLAKVIDPQWTIAEAEKTAVAEFQKEVGKSVGLTKERFFRSMFEIVDTWTSTISAKDYIWFLSSLFKRLTIKKTKTVHGFIAGIGSTGTSLVDYWEYRDLKDIKAWKDMPFFYALEDKMKYRRLQELKNVGPVLPESEEDEDVGEEEDDEDDHETSKSEKLRLKAIEQAKVEEAAAAVTAAEAAEAAALARRASTDRAAMLALSTAAASLARDSESWLASHPRNLDADELLGPIEGENDPSDVSTDSDEYDEDGNKLLFDDGDEEGWPSEVDSGADDPNLTEEERFYGKAESQYEKFQPTPHRTPQPVPHVKPKTSTAQSTPQVDPTAPGVGSPSPASPAGALSPASRKRHLQSAPAPPPVAFPEWMLNTDGASKPKSSDTKVAGGGNTPKGGNTTTSAGTVTHEEKETDENVSVNAEGKSSTTKSKSSRKKRSKKEKALSKSVKAESAALAFKHAMDSIAGWEQTHSSTPTAEAVRSPRMSDEERSIAKKAKAREVRLREIAEMHAAKEARLKEAAVSDAALKAIGLEDEFASGMVGRSKDDTADEDVAPSGNVAVDDDDQSESAILSRLRNKRKVTRNGSIFQPGRGRLLKPGTIVPNGARTTPNDANSNSANAAAATADADVKVKNMSLPVNLTARQQSKSMRGSAMFRAADFTSANGDSSTNAASSTTVPPPPPTKRRPSIFQLIPNLPGPLDGANKERLALLAALPFSSDEEGEDEEGELNSTRGPEGGNDPNTSHQLAVPSNMLTIGELAVDTTNGGNAASSDRVDSSHVGFNSDAFFDAVGSNSLHSGFVPFGARDRVHGRGSVSAAFSPTSIGSAGRTFRRGLGKQIIIPNGVAEGGGPATTTSKKKKRTKRRNKTADDDIFGGLNFGDEPSPTVKSSKKGRAGKAKTPKGDMTSPSPSNFTETPTLVPLPPIEVPDLFAPHGPTLDEDGNPFDPLDLTIGSQLSSAGVEGDTSAGVDDDFTELDRLAARLEQSELAKAKQQEEEAQQRAEAEKQQQQQQHPAPFLMPHGMSYVEPIAEETLDSLDGTLEDQALLASLLADADIQLHPPTITAADSDSSSPSSLASSVAGSPRARPADWAPELAFQTPEMLAAIALQKEREADETWQAAERKRIAQLLGIDSSEDEQDHENEERKLRRRLRKKIVPILVKAAVKTREKKVIAFGKLVVDTSSRPRSRANSRIGLIRRPSETFTPRSQLQKDLAELLGYEEEQCNTIAAALEGEAEAQALLKTMADARSRKRLNETPMASPRVEPTPNSAIDTLHDVVEADTEEDPRHGDMPLTQLPPLPESPTIPSSSHASPLLNTSSTVSVTPLTSILSVDDPSVSLLPGRSHTSDMYLQFRPSTTPIRHDTSNQSPSSLTRPTSTLGWQQFALNQPNESMSTTTVGENADDTTQSSLDASNDDSVKPTKSSKRLSSTAPLGGRRLSIDVSAAESTMLDGPHWSSTLDMWSPRTRFRLMKGGLSDLEIQSAVEVAIGLDLPNQPHSAPPIDLAATPTVLNARQAWLIGQMQQGASDAEKRSHERARERELRREEKRIAHEAEESRRREERMKLESMVEDEVILPEFKPDSHVSSGTTSTPPTPPHAGFDVDGDDSDDDDVGYEPLVLPPALALLPPSLAPQPSARRKAERQAARTPRIDAGEALAASARAERERKAARRAARKKERDDLIARLKPKKNRRRSKESPRGSDRTRSLSPTSPSPRVLIDPNSLVDVVLPPSVIVGAAATGAASGSAATRQTQPTIALFGVRNAPPPSTRVDTEGRVPAGLGIHATPDADAQAQHGLRRGLVFRRGRKNINAMAESDTEAKESDKVDVLPSHTDSALSPSPPGVSIESPGASLPDSSDTSGSNLQPTQHTEPIPSTTPTLASPTPTHAQVSGPTPARTPSANPLMVHSTAAPIATRARSKSPPKRTNAAHAHTSETEDQTQTNEESPSSSLVDSSPLRQHRSGLYSSIHSRPYGGVDPAVPSVLPPVGLDSLTRPFTSPSAPHTGGAGVIRTVIRRPASSNESPATLALDDRLEHDQHTHPSNRFYVTNPQLNLDNLGQHLVRQARIRAQRVMSSHLAAGAEMPLSRHASIHGKTISLDEHTLDEEKTDHSARIAPLYSPVFGDVRPSTTPMMVSSIPNRPKWRFETDANSTPIPTAGPTLPPSDIFGVVDEARRPTHTSQARLARGTAISQKPTHAQYDDEQPPWQQRHYGNPHDHDVSHLVDGVVDPSRRRRRHHGSSRSGPSNFDDVIRSTSMFPPSPSNSNSIGSSSQTPSMSHRHHSPVRGVPTSKLPQLSMPTPPPPVHSFSVPPTAKQDINAALRGTLVAPRFIATTHTTPLPSSERVTRPNTSMPPTGARSLRPVPLVSSGSHTARVGSSDGAHSHLLLGGSQTARLRIETRNGMEIGRERNWEQYHTSTNNNSAMTYNTSRTPTHQQQTQQHAYAQQQRTQIHSAPNGQLSSLI